MPPENNRWNERRVTNLHRFEVDLVMNDNVSIVVVTLTIAITFVSVVFGIMFWHLDRDKALLNNGFTRTRIVGRGMEWTKNDGNEKYMLLRGQLEELVEDES